MEEKKYDTNNPPRLRRDVDQKKADVLPPLEIEERDLRWFSFLHRHGGRLPTTYLHRYTYDTHKKYGWSSERLKNLARHGYIYRDPDQFETRKPESNDLVHETTDKALALIDTFPFAPSPHGAFKHQLMTSCLSASFEMNAAEHGIKFYPQHEVLKREPSIMVDGVKVIPDLVFMLEVDGKKILCFLEVDRGTEGTRTTSVDRKSLEGSVLQYQKIIGGGLYKEHYGVDCGALLFFVTVSEAKVRGVKGVIKEHMGKCSYILLDYIKDFGKPFRPPKILNPIETEWQREHDKPFRLIPIAPRDKS